MKKLYIKFLVDHLWNKDDSLNVDCAEELASLLSAQVVALTGHTVADDEHPKSEIFFSKKNVQGKNTGLTGALRRLILSRCPEITNRKADGGYFSISESELMAMFEGFTKPQMKNALSWVVSKNSSDGRNPLRGISMHKSWKSGYLTVTWTRK